MHSIKLTHTHPPPPATIAVGSVAGEIASCLLLLPACEEVDGVLRVVVGRYARARRAVVRVRVECEGRFGGRCDRAMLEPDKTMDSDT